MEQSDESKYKQHISVSPPSLCTLFKKLFLEACVLPRLSTTEVADVSYSQLRIVIGTRAWDTTSNPEGALISDSVRLATVRMHVQPISLHQRHTSIFYVGFAFLGHF